MSEESKKVRNAIRRVMRAAGIRTDGELGRRAGLSQSATSSLINSRIPPCNKAGNWSKRAIAICNVLDVEPDKVFCQNSPRVVLSDDVIEEAERAAVSRGEAYPEPWRDICRSELLGEIEAAIISLDDESQEVIRAIYIDGETIKRAGERIGRPTTTTDDIRERALRRMSKMPQIVEIRRWG